MYTGTAFTRLPPPPTTEARPLWWLRVKPGRLFVDLVDLPPAKACAPVATNKLTFRHSQQISYNRIGTWVQYVHRSAPHPTGRFPNALRKEHWLPQPEILRANLLLIRLAWIN